MPLECNHGTAGGKGNKGMFIERDPKICAAGVASAQASEDVAGALQQYLLQNEVDALIGDAIIPQPEPRPLPPLRKAMPQDTRNSCAFFGEAASLVNPPNKTKFQTLVHDIKETSYSSYWAKPIGRVRDPTPMLPKGFDTVGTTFGKLNAHENLYDIVMPKVPLPYKTLPAKEAGVQIDRNYCKPPFNPDVIFGHQTHLDKRGKHAKCCITDDKIILGTADKMTMTTVQSNYQDATKPLLGTFLTPNNNINCVPEGYAFGILKPPENLPECLTTCKINEEVVFLRQCLKHLNTLRKVISKRFLPTFFHRFYLNLKYYDTEKTGWLPKDIVYKTCASRLIRFDSSLIEPLLFIWNAFDGSKINYKTFIHVLNYKEPPPDLPKISDLDIDCLDFRTTYSEMVRPDQPPNQAPMAGVPSGRYFDLDYPITPNGCCKANRTCLPHESDAKSCLNPSILTLSFVSHRDMFAIREPDVVRRVFEAVYGKFTDERFNTVWEEAKKLHPQGFVCYQTFRQTLAKIPEERKI